MGLVTLSAGIAPPVAFELERLARRYLRFAREEARDACPIFLAAVQHVDGVPRGGAHLAKSSSAGGSLCAR
jgi:hypothetical protein